MLFSILQELREIASKKTLEVILRKISEFWSNLKIEYKNYERIGVFEEITALLVSKKQLLWQIGFELFKKNWNVQTLQDETN